MAISAPNPEWDDSYTGPPPPWDIGRPQPAFVRLAEAGALTGALTPYNRPKTRGHDAPGASHLHDFAQ